MASSVLRLEGAAAAEDGVLDDLHRDRRAALLDAAGGHVLEQGPDRGPQVDALVAVEVLVLDDDDGVADLLGDLRERHRRPVLLAVQGRLEGRRCGRRRATAG